MYVHVHVNWIQYYLMSVCYLLLLLLLLTTKPRPRHSIQNYPADLIRHRQKHKPNR